MSVKPLGFASSPIIKTLFSFYKRTIMSPTIHRLRPYDIVYLRGPYGNSSHKGDGGSRHILCCWRVGLAPLRPMIELIFLPETDRNTATSKCCRSPFHKRIFNTIMKDGQLPDTDLLLTIDNPSQNGTTLFPNNLVHDISLIFRTLTVPCGPVMIKNCQML